MKGITDICGVMKPPGTNLGNKARFLQVTYEIRRTKTFKAIL